MSSRVRHFRGKSRKILEGIQEWHTYSSAFQHTSITKARVVCGGCFHEIWVTPSGSIQLRDHNSASMKGMLVAKKQGASPRCLEELLNWRVAIKGPGLERQKLSKRLQPLSVKVEMLRFRRMQRDMHFPLGVLPNGGFSPPNKKRWRQQASKMYREEWQRLGIYSWQLPDLMKNRGPQWRRTVRRIGLTNLEFEGAPIIILERGRVYPDGSFPVLVFFGLGDSLEQPAFEMMQARKFADGWDFQRMGGDYG